MKLEEAEVLIYKIEGGMLKEPERKSLDAIIGLGRS